jgi:hypothetical protein
LLDLHDITPPSTGSLTSSLKKEYSSQENSGMVLVSSKSGASSSKASTQQAQKALATMAKDVLFITIVTKAISTPLVHLDW